MRLTRTRAKVAGAMNDYHQEDHSVEDVREKIELMGGNPDSKQSTKRALDDLSDEGLIEKLDTNPVSYRTNHDEIQELVNDRYDDIRDAFRATVDEMDGFERCPTCNSLRAEERIKNGRCDLCRLYYS